MIPETDPARPPALLQTLRIAWLAQRPTLDQREDNPRRLRTALKARMDDMVVATAADFSATARTTNPLSPMV